MNQTDLYALPKDILIKLISQIQEEQNETIKKQSELIHVLQRNEDFLLRADGGAVKCTDCHSIKKYSYKGNKYNIRAGKDIPGICIICEKYKCLDHIHNNECDACVVCDKCDHLVKWGENGHIEDLLDVQLSEDPSKEQIAYSQSNCDFKKTPYLNFQ